MSATGGTTAVCVVTSTTEICTNNVDDNCDGRVDEFCAVSSNLHIKFIATEGPVGPARNISYQGGPDISIWGYVWGAITDGIICPAAADVNPANMVYECNINLAVGSTFNLDAFMPVTGAPAGKISWGDWNYNSPVNCTGANCVCNMWGGNGHSLGTLEITTIPGRTVTCAPQPNGYYYDPTPGNVHCEHDANSNAEMLTYNMQCTLS